MGWILNEIGERATRTDIWVILLALEFVLINAGVFEYHNELNTVRIAMFADLGVNTITKNQNDGREQKSSPKNRDSH